MSEIRTMQELDEIEIGKDEAVMGITNTKTGKITAQKMTKKQAIIMLKLLDAFQDFRNGLEPEEFVKRLSEIVGAEFPVS